MSKPAYAIVAHRWGQINAHNRVVGVKHGLAAAKKLAKDHAIFCGGKYGVSVYSSMCRLVFHAPSMAGEDKPYESAVQEAAENIGFLMFHAAEDHTGRLGGVVLTRSQAKYIKDQHRRAKEEDEADIHSRGPVAGRGNLSSGDAGSIPAGGTRKTAGEKISAKKQAVPQCYLCKTPATCMLVRWAYDPDVATRRPICDRCAHDGRIVDFTCGYSTAPLPKAGGREKPRTTNGKP